MPKKAILADLSIRTRVVVDVPEGKAIHSEEMVEAIAQKAVEKVRKNTMQDEDYPCLDNVVRIQEDTEVPYGAVNEDDD